jgi:hypothetical protein
MMRPKTRLRTNPNMVLLPFGGATGTLLPGHAPFFRCDLPHASPGARSVLIRSEPILLQILVLTRFVDANRYPLRLKTLLSWLYGANLC